MPDAASRAFSSASLSACANARRGTLMVSGRRLIALSLLFIAADVWAVKETLPSYPAENTELPQSTRVSYTNATDQELNALGAQWARLSAAERRALLAEVRMRWARDRNGSTRVRIQATRQFGVVRQADGTTIRVERRIIRMIPADKGYGAGFEQRVERRDDVPSSERGGVGSDTPVGLKSGAGNTLRVNVGQPDQSNQTGRSEATGNGLLNNPAAGEPPASRSGFIPDAEGRLAPATSLQIGPGVFVPGSEATVSEPLPDSRLSR